MCSLCRRTQNNAVLIGELVARLPSSKGSRRNRLRRRPAFLADKRILALDISLIVAGTKYAVSSKTPQGDRELTDGTSSCPSTARHAGGAGSREVARRANILAGAEPRGNPCIGLTTPAEHKNAEGSVTWSAASSDGSPGEARTRLLGGTAARTSITISREARAAVYQSSRYIRIASCGRAILVDEPLRELKEAATRGIRQDQQASACCRADGSAVPEGLPRRSSTASRITARENLQFVREKFDVKTEIIVGGARDRRGVRSAGVPMAPSTRTRATSSCAWRLSCRRSSAG